MWMVYDGLKNDLISSILWMVYDELNNEIFLVICGYGRKVVYTIGLAYLD